MSALLSIRDLKVTIEEKQILNGVDLEIPHGEIHAFMGPNGSGKSTLANVIMGHPAYTIVSGDIFFKGQSILGLSVDERARAGIFLSFQYPSTIPGVTVTNLLRNVIKNIRGAELKIRDFRIELKEAMANLEMSPDFAGRYVNDGFSGGEKKRNEILQMSMMKPGLAILDEIDSGLDIDALRVIAQNVEKMKTPDRSMLVITHYKRLLDYLSVDRIHVFKEGRVIQSGGTEIADKLEKEGYVSYEAAV